MGGGAQLYHTLANINRPCVSVDMPGSPQPGSTGNQHSRPNMATLLL